MRPFLCALALLMAAAWPCPGGEGPLRPLIALTAEEQAWIAAHPAMRIALDDANPPMNFRRGDGVYAGISVDYLQLIAAKAGLRLDLVGASWNEALGQAMRHEVDGIMSASWKAERLTALAFTHPYCETPEAVLTQDDFPPLPGLSGLAGRRVAVVAGSVRIALLGQQAPTAIITEVVSAGEGVRALAEGRVDAFFDDLPVIQDQVDRTLVAHLRVALLYLQPEAGAQRIGVRNDQPLLTVILDKAIAAITPDEHRAIRDRWLRLAGDAVVQRDLGLTTAERDWIATHPEIRVGCDPDWAPIEWRDGDGHWRGLSMDYLERLHALLGIRFAIDDAASWQEMLDRAASGRIDLIASLSRGPGRDRDWILSPPYVGFPIAIFARSEVGYLHGIEALVGSRVVVVAGYVEEAQLRGDWPGLNLVTAPNTAAALAMVRQGEAKAMVGGLPTTAQVIQREGITDVHVVGETPFAYSQCLAVRRDLPLLGGIIAKGLQAIPPEERDGIWRRWVTMSTRRVLDHSLIWKLGLPMLAALAAFWYWNRRLRAEVRQRIRAESELIAYRDRLADMVRDRTAELEDALGRLRRLAAAIEQTADGVVLASPDGRIGFVNPAFALITGIPAGEAIGRSLASLGVPWNDPAARAGRWHGHVSGRRPDGTSYEVEMAISAVHGPDGTLVDLLADLRDVTAARQIEERLRRTQKLEAIGTLAGGIAHDFNNILAAIMGSAEIASMPGCDEVQRAAAMERILAACNRARDLVRQILSFARADAGGASRPVEVASVVAEALCLLRASLPATIAFRQRLEPGLTVLGDPTRLHQVMMNLGTNAGLAMPAGGVLEVELVRIEIDPAFAEQHGGLRTGPAARLIVRDTGVGMSREVQARIFEPFFTTREHGRGTGLGLSVVHGVIRDAGGAISVYSEPGRGTSFTIVLPLVARADSPARALPHAARGGGERILFVDDEEILRRIAAEILGSLGYVVTTADDGAAALELIRRDPSAFDLVITDATMPRLTGPELIVAARAIVPGLRIIMCSGRGDAEPDQRPADVSFLVKPVTMCELAGAVRAALGEGGGTDRQAP